MEIGKNEHSNWLECPKCGDGYLHISSVNINSCNLNLKTMVGTGSVDVSNIGHSSGSDDIVEILMYCENCRAESKDDNGGGVLLKVNHHEGMTFISMKEV